MIHFVGAGPGAKDLITVRGADLIKRAGMIVYAGSLVNPALLEDAKPECEIHDSATLTLEEVVALLRASAGKYETVVRLHTGDPSLYGAIREQMDALDALGLAYEIVPGVSSFLAAAAALKKEYTLPSVSQTLIISRLAGRTPVPEGEALEALAAHGASMALFLSAGMLPELSARLLAGGYAPETPAAIVYKASWPDERRIIGTVRDLPIMGEKLGVKSTALVLIGGFLDGPYDRSRLYDPAFSHGYRMANDPNL